MSRVVGVGAPPNFGNFVAVPGVFGSSFAVHRAIITAVSGGSAVSVGRGRAVRWCCLYV